MMWAIKILLYLVCAYLLFLVITFFVQRRLLYLPDRRMPSKMGIQTSGLRFWPSEGQTYRGFIGPEKTTAYSGTVIVFHGNAGAAWNRDFYIQKLKPLGFRVVLAEYPGYGGRSDKMSEKNFIADAKTTVRLVYEEYGKPIFLCGESLGCGVATGVLADSPVPIQGLVLITPWDSLPDLAQTIYWYLPARWLVYDKYDNIRNARGFPGPVAVILAEHDEIVPRHHGMRFYESLATPKKLWILKGEGHNSWPRMADTSWWREAMEFITWDKTNSLD
jgi:alpha-beta hydrolase superfamily lysophospholipase